MLYTTAQKFGVSKIFLNIFESLLYAHQGWICKIVKY